jgi:hypothetical protein
MNNIVLAEHLRRCQHIIKTKERQCILAVYNETKYCHKHVKIYYEDDDIPYYNDHVVEDLLDGLVEADKQDDFCKSLSSGINNISGLDTKRNESIYKDLYGCVQDYNYVHIHENALYNGLLNGAFLLMLVYKKEITNRLESK